MTGDEFYDLLKYVLTFWTAAGILIGLVKRWLDKLLEAHLKQVQQSLEGATAALTDLARSGKEFLQTQHELAESAKLMQHDFHDHVKEDERVQGSILTSLEVIRVQTSGHD